MDKKRREENLTKDASLERVLGPPFVWCVCVCVSKLPSCVIALFFLAQKSMIAQSRSLFGGVQELFGRARFSSMFLPPIIREKLKGKN